jgi:peptidyl-prolyl cis-trans isomerase A (cyclophilin A)
MTRARIGRILSGLRPVPVIAWVAACMLLVLPVLAQAQTPRRRRTVSTENALLHPALLHAHAPAVLHVRFHTTKGDFAMEVVRAWAPIGADRFYNLVEHHFYDDASLFRVVPGFVVQFGLPANPKVGMAWANATIKDDPVKESNQIGYVTFATAGPDTRTTQVFINLGNNTRLDRMGFAPFGKVSEGMSVVEQFYGGYGDNGPNQGLLTREGKSYVEKNFPKLDTILTARIVPAGSAHPAAHSPPHPSSH